MGWNSGLRSRGEHQLETGDPLTGPSTWILKARPGCVVAWHSHTAEEQLIVVLRLVTRDTGGRPAEVWITTAAVR
jgi:hypothetical protein